MEANPLLTGSIWKGVALGLWVSAAGMGFGDEYFVRPGGDDSALGTTLEEGFETLQRGIDAAEDGDTVWVADGVYTLASQVTLVKGVVVRSVNGAAQAIVNGNGSGSYRCFFIDHPDAVLSGFTVTNAYLNLNVAGGEERYGGGIYMLDGTVEQCVIAGNKIVNIKDHVDGTGYGAGIALFGGTLLDCVVTGNTLEVKRPNFGAGVYIGGPAIVSNCTIAWNTANADRYIGISRGGGVYMADGMLRNSLIHHNDATGVFDVYGTAHGIGNGGGVFIDSGVMENCLVVGNRALTRGGGVYQTGGAMRHCTVSRNIARVDGCGLYKETAGEVVSSIIWDNLQLGNLHGDTYANKDVSVASGSQPTYSCARELTSGTGNLAVDPLFRYGGNGYGLDLNGGDFRLGIGSPCLNAGFPDESVEDDLAGSARPQDGNGSGTPGWDMGAYETPDAATGAFRCDFTATPAIGIGSLDVVLTALVGGEVANVTNYWWDFTNDGIDDASGSELSAPIHAYGPGRHSVALRVMNDAGETATFVRTNVVYVAPTVAHVATNGAGVFPYDTWAKAATNIQDAVNAAARVGDESTLVLVSNGVYQVATQIGIAKGVTVRSVQGPDHTIVDADNVWRGFYLGDAQAVLDGFTVVNGYVTFTERRDDSYGGGIYIASGTAQHCVVSNCVATSGFDLKGNGGGVFVGGTGVLSNSLVTGNQVLGKTTGRTPSGGGVYMGSGTPLVSHCIITRNEGPLPAGTGGGHGGGVFMVGGTLRNSLVAGNHGALRGGGVYMASGSQIVESCTVVQNASTHANSTDGGIYRNSGTVVNTIVRDNSSVGAPFDLALHANVTYCCAPELTSGTGNRSEDPLFRLTGSGAGLSYVPGDYRLAEGSLCINRGVEKAWMKNAPDLAGALRIAQDIVDLGAYEWSPERGTVLTIR